MNIDWAMERLHELRREYETGQAHLDDIEQQRVFTVESMLRISGAIRVLEELVEQTGVFDPTAASTVN